MAFRRRTTEGSIVLSILTVLFVWNIFFVLVNALVRLIDINSILSQYDPHFLKPAVDFVTSLNGWFLTILGNAFGFLTLLIISYVYDITEVE